MTKHAGGCRCGAVRFSASADPHFTSFCHCDDCRRATGAPVVAFVGFHAGEVTWQGDVCATYGEPPVERFFCPKCGSPIGYRDGRIGNTVYFYTAIMDRPEDYPPARHGYARAQLPWLHLTDDLPRFETTTIERMNTE